MALSQAIYTQPSAPVYQGKHFTLNVIVLFQYIIFRLGKACNHIAALLFYKERHAHDAELPTKKSKLLK